MGASIKFWRNNKDGDTTLNWTPYGSQVTWTPPYYPYDNTGARAYRAIDGLFGFAQYIAQKAHYYTKTVNTVDINGNASSYHDFDKRYVQTVVGYGGVQSGVTMQDVITEIDEGRPLMAILWRIDSGAWTTIGHAIAVFGYRKIMTEGQLTGLDLLTYDTWYQDSDGVHTPYSIVPFPGATQANDPSVTSLSRERRKCDGTQYTEYWKLYAFSFLRINKDDGYHPRCQHPLQSGQYTIESHDEPFDISIGNSAIAGCTRVHYSTDRDPTPESPYVTLDASGNGTKPIHVDAGCALKFRTYRDAPANKPEDGCVASAVDKRTFTVTAPNKNPKKYADGDGIITAPLVATVGTGPLGSNICYVEDQQRVNGIRVQTSNSVAQGDLVTVSGTLGTNSDGERVITSAAVTSLGATDPITPLGMPNRTLGGADLNYSSTTGAGQQGITDGVGLNNIGLLLKTTGCVCSHSTSSFEITDGSPQPITVITPSGMDPLESGYVGVTGVCSRQSNGNGGYKPVLLVRSTDDIQVYSESCVASGSGSQSSAPIRSRPEVPVVEATDMIAWALKQTDGTTVTVKACSVLDSAAGGLTISDGWIRNAATIHVQGNWAVNQWSTVDVTGVVTTLPGGTRAITPTQILVYTDSRGRRYEFPMPFWRNPSGQLIEDWPYKEAASLRSL